jgi:hypothetical protein
MVSIMRVTVLSMPSIAVLALASCLCAGTSRAGDGPPARATTGATMKLRLVTADAVVTASLDDSATARDFASLLPLTLTLRDHARTEKVSDLPRKLTTTGAPSGADPRVGDIAYYAPWGNLAIFYRDFRYSDGLVTLGRIESGLAKLAGARGDVVVRIEVDATGRR